MGDIWVTSLPRDMYWHMNSRAQNSCLKPRGLFSFDSFASPIGLNWVIGVSVWRREQIYQSWSTRDGGNIPLTKNSLPVVTGMRNSLQMYSSLNKNKPPPLRTPWTFVLRNFGRTAGLMPHRLVECFHSCTTSPSFISRTSPLPRKRPHNADRWVGW
jgi:hypothetical protein